MRCNIREFATAYELAIETASSWCEGHRLGGVLLDNDVGVKFSRTAGNYSFASQIFDHLIIQLTNANADVPYGFYIDTDLDIYRSVFIGCTIFARKANCVGFYSDGKMRNVFGTINMEGSGASIGNTGFKFGPNATLNRFKIYSDMRGSITTPYDIPAGLDYEAGFETDSLTYAGARIRRQGVESQIRSIYDTDTTTRRYVEKVNAGDVIEHEYADPPKFVTQAGKVSGVVCVPVGPGQLTHTSGATPDVAGIKTVRLALAAPGNITDFLNGIDEQTIVVHHNNTNVTLVHGTNLFLQGSASFTPASSLTRHVFQRYGGVWWEISRVTP